MCKCYDGLIMAGTVFFDEEYKNLLVFAASASTKTATTSNNNRSSRYKDSAKLLPLIITSL